MRAHSSRIPLKSNQLRGSELAADSAGQCLESDVWEASEQDQRL